MSRAALVAPALLVAGLGFLIAPGAAGQQSDSIRDCIPAEIPPQLPALGVCFPEFDARASPPVAREFVTVSPFTIGDLAAAGRARIRVLVSEGGTVMRVELAQTSGSTVIDNAVLDAYRSARFKPTLLDGVPTQGWFDSGRPRWRGPPR